MVRRLLCFCLLAGRFWMIAVLALVIFLAAVAPPTAPASATFGVKPNELTIDAAHPIAQVAFSSLSARVVSFDVRVQRWRQTAAADAFEPAPNAIVVPPIFSISPYDTVLLRVTFRQPPVRPEIEASYKVVLTEITPAGPQGSAVRVVSVPLFVPARSPTGTASYRLRPTMPGAADLIIKNGKNAHLFLGKLSITSGAKRVYEGKPGVYVLAGNTRVVPLRLTAALSGAGAEIQFENAAGATQSAEATVVR
jgi:P pilus assembly chaperone PapD